jgi:hypothetical protein
MVLLHQADPGAGAPSGTRENSIMIKVRNTLCAAALVCSVFSTGAFAGFNPTPAEKSDCMSDVMSLCSYAIPSMDRIGACLTEKKDQLSPVCRAHFDKK